MGMTMMGGNPGGKETWTCFIGIVLQIEPPCPPPSHPPQSPPMPIYEEEEAFLGKQERKRGHHKNKNVSGLRYGLIAEEATE